MEYGAIDLHARRSQIRIVDERGSLVLDRRVDTTRDGLGHIFRERARLRVLVESSTHSEWVALYLEELGHDVIVADPNYAAMYGARSRRIKTDRRDAAALAEACRTGVYRPAHRVNALRRQLRQTLRVRRHTVAMRTRAINLIKALLGQEGLRMPSGAAEDVLRRLDRVTMPLPVARVLQPLRELLAHLNASLARADAALRERATADPVACRAMTMPGVGPIVALTFQAVLDSPERFGGHAGRVTSFLGLVPSEASSGERQHKGRITKAGPRELRALLVQAGWVVWRTRSRPAAPLRDWVHALAERRGRRVAIIAVARRLARMLYAMWRDGTEFMMPTAHQPT